MRQRYASDLTDTQWGHLRAGVFAGHADPDRARAAVDGVRYREQARLPWHLLPPAFAPADELRRAHAEWTADGTWAAVERVVAEYPAPPFWLHGHPASGLADRVRGLPGGAFLVKVASALPRPVRVTRRRAARAAKRVPGGRAALAPGRWLIQAAQAACRPFTVHARLPGWFAEAHARLYGDKDYAGARELFTRILAYDPGNHFSYLRRAECNTYLGNPAEVIDDCLTALSFPALGWGDRATAHALISQAAVLSGEVERAVAHAHLFRRIQRDGPGVRWDLDDAADGPDDYAAVIDLHRDLAEHAINARTDFTTAAELYRRAERVRADYARWLATVPARTLYLNEDWTRAIGHTALIDFWVKMDRLGLRTWDRIVLVTDLKKAANPALVGFYDQYLDVVRVEACPPALRGLVTAFGPRVGGLIPQPGGGERYITEGMGLVQEAWERAGRAPLLALTPADEEYGRTKLRALGVPDGAWFVALHVRSPGYHKEGVQVHQSHRNADIATYLQAAREVVRRGGWVVRMGDTTMPRLPPTPGVIDYAHSPGKSARMDVFLCAACRFFVGVASGISHVPTAFGVPCVLTNWLSNALPVYSRYDLFLPKLLRSAADGRFVPFDQYLAADTRLLCYSGEKLFESDLVAVDNTPGELRDAVVEMLDQLDAGAPAPPAREVAAFDATARRHGLVGFSRLGRDFAAKHAALFGPEAPARAA